jgi:hypothetical protein
MCVVVAQRDGYEIAGMYRCSSAGLQIRRGEKAPTIDRMNRERVTQRGGTKSARKHTQEVLSSSV